MAVITKQELIDAARDAADLEKVVNGTAGESPVTTRLGGSLKTLAKILSDLYGTDIGGPLAAALDARLDLVEPVAALFDISSNRYLFGKLVDWALMDAAARTGLVVTTDGTVYGKFAIKLGVSNGLSLVRDPADGFLSLAFGTVEGQVPLGALSIDSTIDRYVAGKKVVWAVSDPNNRSGATITEDGFFRAKLAVAAGAAANGLSVTNNADGSLSLNFGTTANILPLGDSGGAIDTTGMRYFGGKRVTRSWSASDLASSIVETEDGEIYIHKLASPSLDRAGGSASLESADHVFDVVTVASLQQIVRTPKSGGPKVQATSSGNNFAPRLSLDNSKVIYVSDRTGSRQSYYQLTSGAKLGGAVEHPVRPSQVILPLGDSLTAANMAAACANVLGTSLLFPASGAETGIGSQQSDRIAARYGAAGLGGLAAITCSLTGNTMTSGANVLTAISSFFLSKSADTAGAVRSLRAAILGVVGTITSTQSASPATGYLAADGQYYLYTFTPDGGQTLPGSVAAGSILVVDPEARQDATLQFWPGRNDVLSGAGWQARVATATAAVFAAYKPLVRHIQLVGITNARDEPSGSTNYNDIVAYNLAAKALYPDSFWDPRPTYNAGEATDIPKAAFSADNIHYNEAGRLALGAAAAADMIAKGWY